MTAKIILTNRVSGTEGFLIKGLKLINPFAAFISLGPALRVFE